MVCVELQVEKKHETSVQTVVDLSSEKAGCLAMYDGREYCTRCKTCIDLTL